jgi:signal transduction histidine kinase
VHKVADLDACYAELLRPGGDELARGPTRTGALSPPTLTAASRTRTTGTTNLDFMAVMRAAQSIAESIVLEDLLGRLMRISLETAGAERGALLLEKDGALVVVAEASAASPSPFERRDVPLHAWDGPRSILSFVKRALESVVLGEATKEARFSSDRYLERSKVRSILAMPIIKQGRLIGALYLENNLAAHAFTAERVEVLHALAGQMATSLENAKLYEELSRALAEAKKSVQLKSQFLANTSHELRTPLNTIINVPEGILAQLSEPEVVHCNGCGARFEKEEGQHVGPDTPCDLCGARALAVRKEWVSTMAPGEMVPLLRAIESSGHYLLDIVNSILDYSRIEAGQARMQPEPVDLRQLFQKIEEGLKPLATRKRIGLSFLLTDEDMPQVLADPVKLRQILNNLVGNAVKFSPAGRNVEVRGRMIDGETYEVSVRDEGIGIPKDQQEVIFESFRQVDGGDTRTHGGTGLGLAISKKLTEMHGGTIAVESEPTKGSVFRMHLPLKGPRQGHPEVTHEALA